ncbi:unnamed protein product, partial [Owenia fusiformis]
MTITPQIMDINEDQKPRFLVYSKMEKLIQDMQHPETGVSVRCQKIFLTTIPCAFTGLDLVEWLSRRLRVCDNNEAIHIATHLCQHGYFFPVTEMRNLVVKDDQTLYRFQSPYFWPSQNWQPDNVDYAIYLAKRTLRNKQKHGLEDYEHSAFNKLQKMLCDKWEFIYMHAEEQVRLAKDRKKADKVVLDSQERAFWRVNKPPPGSIRLGEEGVRRNHKPSQMNLRKKKNCESYKKEIDYLQQCTTRPKMKTSKATESLLARCEQFSEHDPWLGGAQPSNPWVTEDTTMWMLNTVLVDSPTERRVKRWGFCFNELLSDATGKHEFEVFLKKEFSQENIWFWLACEDLKYSPSSKVQEKVKAIYREFLAPGAPCEINIDSKTMEKTQQNLQSPSRFTFDEAQAHIYSLMKKDSYARFLRSDHYKSLLLNALQPNSIKKKFSLANVFQTMGRRKKSSPMLLRQRSHSFNDLNAGSHWQQLRIARSGVDAFSSS